MSVCVIYNPQAGKGRARRQLAKLSVEFPDCEIWPTRRAGQASELATEAARRGFAVVVAAGGDGTVHEVANGLLYAERSDTALSIWPIGSANDYAYSLGLLKWWGRRDRASRTRRLFTVDVGRVRGGQRIHYFVNGLGLGFNSAVTLESRQIRGLTGLALYGLALIRAVWRHYRAVPMRVQWDEDVREQPTLALSVSLGQREGGFPMFPQASLTDGLFDGLHAGNVGQWEILRFLPSMIAGTLPRNHPRLWLGQASRVRVQAAEPLRVHLDGEFFCQPDDAIRELEIELLPRRLVVAVGLREPG